MRALPPFTSIRITPATNYPPGQGWHWYDWEVEVRYRTGRASGVASSYKRAQRFARKAARQLERDGGR